MSYSTEARFDAVNVQGPGVIDDEISEPIEIENSVHVEILTKKEELTERVVAAENEEPIEKKEVVAIKPGEPKEKVRIDPITQIFTEIVVWTMYNEMAVGDLARCNLKGYDALGSASQTLQLRVGEPSVLSSLVFLQNVDTSKNPGSPGFTLRTSIPMTAIKGYNFRVADKKNMSDAMAKALPNDWHYKGYGVVSFEAEYVHLSAFADEIPVTLVPNAAEELKNYVRRVQSATNTPLHYFEFIVRSKYVRDMHFLKRVHAAWERDNESNPYHKWIRNSPHHHQLGLGNLFAPGDRPPFTKAGLVLSQDDFWQSKLQYQVHLTYAQTIENAFEVATVAAWQNAILNASITDVPGSCNLKDNENDNDLPKLYSLTMTIQNMEVDMPSIGELYNITLLDFKPPPCPDADVEVDDESGDEDIDSEDDCGDYSKPRKSNKENHAENKENREEMAEEQARVWRGQVVSVFDGLVEIIITRPSDPRWKGSKSLKPRVNTVIPTHSHRFGYASRYKEELESAAKHRVKMVPQLSSRVYKDLINGIQAFCTVEHTPELISSEVHAHLCEVLVTRRRRTPFHGKKLKRDIFGPNYKDFLTHMSSAQKAAFDKLEIVDGLVVINGFIASGKTMSAVCVSVCAVNNTSSQRKQCVLAISETNSAVDSLAQEFYQFISNPKEPSEGRQHLIIRLLPLEGEMNTVKTRLIPKQNNINFLADDALFAGFLGEVEANLYGYGQTVEAARIQGDKRKTAKIKTLNLTLEQAMWRELINSVNDGDTDSNKLLLLLRRIHQSKLEFKEKATLKDLLQRLCLLTISKADVIVCTIAMAIRPDIAKILGKQVTHILMGDGGKTGSSYLIAIVAKYPKLDFLIVEGDKCQQTPYTRTHLNPEFPNPFSRVLKESALGIAMQLTSHDACLVHQRRMWTQDICVFLSGHYYAGKLRDGNEKKKKPVEFMLCHEFINDTLKVQTNGNFVMFHMESRDTIQKVGTSPTNQHHQMTALDIIKKLIVAVDANKLGVDKKRFNIEYLSPYKAQVHEMNVLIKKLGDNRVNASTFKTVQGIGRNVVIVDFTGSNRLTDFADDTRDTLVALSRHKHALFVICNSKSTFPDSYADNAREAIQLKGVGRNICSLAEFAQGLNALIEIPAPEVGNCFKCNGVGHKANECTVNTTFVSKCRNCNGTHDYDHCPGESTGLNNVVCRRCHQIGHKAVKCEAPWCQKCRVIGHDKEGCPQKLCVKCKATDHWFVRITRSENVVKTRPKPLCQSRQVNDTIKVSIELDALYHDADLEGREEAVECAAVGEEIDDSEANDNTRASEANGRGWSNGDDNGGEQS
ncbi:uncharacterized protein EAE98_000883 [Botrytis deweyae]|uniref:CCHC-type domain-containing protein n=1 Tax=Botrytis deweyae TaxID=2478750 RepID=A0ABQ7IZX3_9HELO|nr:uncharacterized protein EAE98_000883 [Botrytis deweyae]KAF7938545.1 hypothetical protein EAE98_000883 [Botrytis deweyae]